jgi:hypothetical protein
VSTHVLELSTQVAAAKTFTVDGEEYNLLGFEHLSPEEEAEVQAKFARFDTLNRQLELTGDDTEAKNLAKKLRSRRIELLTKVTTMPLELADKLPLPEQIKIMKAIQAEVGSGGDEVS